MKWWLSKWLPVGKFYSCRNKSIHLNPFHSFLLSSREPLLYFRDIWITSFLGKIHCFLHSSRRQYKFYWLIDCYFYDRTVLFLVMWRPVPTLSSDFIPHVVSIKFSKQVPRFFTFVPLAKIGCLLQLNYIRLVQRKNEILKNTKKYLRCFPVQDLLTAPAIMGQHLFIRLYCTGKYVRCTVGKVSTV